jgi:CubicO group peptidase (beta-lactamase class C family)
MENFAWILCIAICPAVFCGGYQLMAQPANETDRSAQVDSLFSPIDDSDAPGASVIVIQNGEVLHRKGYGMANIEHSVPNTPETKFRLGSITKSFTAIAVMQLHEKEKLNTSDYIGKYLPDFPNGDRITIHHLLTHTSGIAESDKEPLQSEPGERLNYSNFGYILLGRIVEKVSGKSYEEYLKENIFLPLNMINSGYDHHATILKNRASGYSVSGDGKFINADYMDMSGPFAAGGLYSTIEDMYLWDQVLYTDKLLKPSTLEQAFTPVKLNDGRQGVYGLGWMINQNRGLKEVGHGGDITGFNSYIARFPEQRFTVIVLSNVGMHPPGPLPNAGTFAHRIAEIYLSDKMQPVEKRVQIKIDPEIYDAYAGQYELEAPDSVISVSGSMFTISKEGDQLFLESKLGKSEILPESETVFQQEDPPFKLIFVKDNEGQVTEIIISVMGIREFRAKRLSERDQ